MACVTIASPEYPCEVCTWAFCCVLNTNCDAAVLTSYEKHFPLKTLAPVFAKIEAAREEAERARDAAKKIKIAAEKAGSETGEASLDAMMEEKIPQPGGHCSLIARRCSRICRNFVISQLWTEAV